MPPLPIEAIAPFPTHSKIAVINCPQRLNIQDGEWHAQSAIKFNLS